MNPRNRAILIGVYVTVVLLFDALAANRVLWYLDFGIFDFTIDWSIFTWRGDGRMAQFDYFKFLFWFVIPVALCFWEMDWGYFGFTRWTRGDVYLLLGLSALGLVSLAAVAFIPQLREYYPSVSSWSWQSKSKHAYQQLLWNISWLPGWEFLHRYFLLRPFQEKWPRAGWIVVPIAEGLYHLQKHPLEMAGMVVMSILFTQWAVRRKNLMLPLLVHACIEAGLVAFTLLI